MRRVGFVVARGGEGRGGKSCAQLGTGAGEELPGGGVARPGAFRSVFASRSVFVLASPETGKGASFFVRRRRRLRVTDEARGAVVVIEVGASGRAQIQVASVSTAWLASHPPHSRSRSLAHSLALSLSHSRSRSRSHLGPIGQSQLVSLVSGALGLAARIDISLTRSIPSRCPPVQSSLARAPFARLPPSRPRRMRLPRPLPGPRRPRWRRLRPLGPLDLPPCAMRSVP